MKSLRQLSGGIIIGLVSVVLVVGGIFLSLAESFRSSVPTPTQIPPTFPLSFPTATPSPASAQSAQSETPTVTLTTIPLLPSATLLAPTVCTPPSGWIQITITANDTIYSIAQRYRTTTENLSAANCLTSLDLPAGYVIFVPPVPATVTVIPCGPFAGWVRTYTVQPGDNLFRISLSYGTTVPQLQRANCLGTSTTIFTGQRLWVPNVPTLTPGITIVPNFPTATNTLQPTATTAPPTASHTAEPPTATLATTTEVPSTPTINAPTSTSSSPAASP